MILTKICPKTAANRAEQTLGCFGDLNTREVHFFFHVMKCFKELQANLKGDLLDFD